MWKWFKNCLVDLGFIEDDYTKAKKGSYLATFTYKDLDINPNEVTCKDLKKALKVLSWAVKSGKVSERYTRRDSVAETPFRFRLTANKGGLTFHFSLIDFNSCLTELSIYHKDTCVVNKCYRIDSEDGGTLSRILTSAFDMNNNPEAVWLTKDNLPLQTVLKKIGADKWSNLKV